MPTAQAPTIDLDHITHLYRTYRDDLAHVRHQSTLR